MNDETVSDEKQKPVLDEKALERLLEAAFVLQEHNREQEKLDLSLELQSEHLRQQESAPPQSRPSIVSDASAATPDYTLTLAQIVEAQRHIQVHHLQLDAAMALVVERLTAFTNAAGGAIGILVGKKVRYRAASGETALPVGTEVAMEKALCLACLKVGQVIRCADVNTEFLFDVAECRRRGIQSLIAVPIYHGGLTAGALELYFAKSHSFNEQDVHSCQLMAGLVTEAFARHDELNLKQSLAAERATMLSALEKLRPNLTAIVGTPAAIPVSSQSGSCGKCGHEMGTEEQFCGNCGSPRGTKDDATSLENKMAALLKMAGPAVLSPAPPAAEKFPDGPPLSATASEPVMEPAETLDEDLLASLQASFEKERVELSDPFVETQESGSDLAQWASALEKGEEDNEVAFEEDSFEDESSEMAPAEVALVKAEHDLTWSSAAKTREVLEQLAAGRNQSPLARFWTARRGDIYLAAAVILVAVVIRWGIWSNHSVSATGGPTTAAGHRRPAPDADLSILDRMLINVDLAEAPEAPEARGNPETQVWVDLHTALYYCPGSDLYGKTPKGKYTTQRDAQLDQFEPAARKACD